MSKKKDVIFTSPRGGKYEGEYKDGKRNGQGTFTYPDGTRYVGEYKDGMRSGLGTQTYPDGGKYEGSWKNGVRWNGTSYDKNGNIIEKWGNGVEQK